MESVVCNKRINSSLLMNLQFITQELKNPNIGIGISFALKFNIGTGIGSNFGIGTSLIRTPVRIWKRYIPLLIDLLISNNFSSMTFICATRILRVIGRQSIRQSTDFLLIFFCIIKNKTSKIKFIK